MHYMTAGEAHGPGHVVIVSDVPAGLRVQESAMAEDVARWAKRFGQEPRAAGNPGIIAGVMNGHTTGAPVAVLMAAPVEGVPADDPQRSAARPATADLVGMLKTGASGCYAVSERACVQERACAIAASGVAREFLASLGVEIHSYVTRIGDASMRANELQSDCLAYTPLEIETSTLRCPSGQATRMMETAIREAMKANDTLGGSFTVVVSGAVAGLGGYAEPGQNIAAALSAAVFNATGVTSVAFGRAAAASRMRGTIASDAVEVDLAGAFGRASNTSGGIEGGMTTGMPVVMHATVSPSPFVGVGVSAFDANTCEPAQLEPAAYDACTVPSSAVEAEAQVAFTLAQAYFAKFGGDSMSDIAQRVQAYAQRVKCAAR